MAAVGKVGGGGSAVRSGAAGAHVHSNARYGWLIPTAEVQARLTLTLTLTLALALALTLTLTLTLTLALAIL